MFGRKALEPPLHAARGDGVRALLRATPLTGSKQMASSEFVAGAGLQIRFKMTGLLDGFKGRVEFYFPREEFRGVRASARIVFGQAPLEIRGMASIQLRWVVNTLKNASVKHEPRMASLLRMLMKGQASRSL